VTAEAIYIVIELRYNYLIIKKQRNEKTEMTSFQPTTAEIIDEVARHFLSTTIQTLEATAQYNREMSEQANVERNSRMTEVVAQLKRANTETLHARYQRVTGEMLFNPYQERYHMIDVLSDAIVEAEFGPRQYVGMSEHFRARFMRKYFGIKPLGAGNGRFDEEQIEAIRKQRINRGLSYAKIAKWIIEEFGTKITGDMVRSICIGECYKDVAQSYIEVR
jgi:hypothetical protein